MSIATRTSEAAVDGAEPHVAALRAHLDRAARDTADLDWVAITDDRDLPSMIAPGRRWVPATSATTGWPG